MRPQERGAQAQCPGPSLAHGSTGPGTARPRAALGGKADLCSHWETGDFEKKKKLKIELQFDPTIPLLGVRVCVCACMYKICVHIYIYMYKKHGLRMMQAPQCSQQCYSQLPQTGAPQASINRGLDKEDVIHTRTRACTMKYYPASKK